MFGWPGASQAHADFCWDLQVAAPLPQPLPAAPAAQPATQGQWGKWTGAGPAPGTLAPPSRPPAAAPQVGGSRSGVAALSAQQARAAGGGVSSDPFSFEEAAPGHSTGAQEEGGWRSRGVSFLASGGGSRGGAGGSRPPAAAAAAPTGLAQSRLGAGQQQQHLQRQPATAAVRHPSTQLPPALARPAARPAVPAAAAKPAAGAAPSSARPPPAAPPATPIISLSLEKYVDFLQLLTKGTGKPQPLSDLEKSILKAADMKQARGLGGGQVGTSRTRREGKESRVGSRAPEFGLDTRT